MKVLRRTLFSLFVGAVVGAAMRLRGTGGVPPQGGGWREIDPRSLG